MTRPEPNNTVKPTPIPKPLLHECFLHWTEDADANGDETLRLFSWRRSLTLKGKSFRTFEREVLPLLTGMLSVDEICDKLAGVFQKEDILAAFDMLVRQGILVDGEGALIAGKEERLTPQRGWLAENAPDGSGAQQKLVDAHIVLFGAGLHGATVARSLVAAGVGHLTIVDPTIVAKTDLYFSGLFQTDDIGKNRALVLSSTLARGESGTLIESETTQPTVADIVSLANDASLVLSCLDSGLLNLSLRVADACRQSRTPWIAASLEGTELVVGPGFFKPADGPCYTCWRMREISSAANPLSRLALEQRLDQIQTDLSPRRENLAASADIVGGMLAAEVITWLSGSTTPNLDGRFITVEVPGFRTEKHLVLRRPDCPVCNASQRTST
jgi:adenylyltransferase/sulfurtransferase